MKHHLLCALAFAIAMLVTTTAFADETVTVQHTIVAATPQRPSVTIEIVRIRMQLAVTTPTLAAGFRAHVTKKESL